MWLCMNDAFLSIVKKDCPEDSLLVRARRPGDIEKVFGRRTKVTRATDADYLYRAVVAKDDVVRAMQDEVLRVSYPNFKDSVQDNDLHDAYMKVWSAMASLQNPRPYSEPFTKYGNVAWTGGGHVASSVQAPLKTPSGGSSVKPPKYDLAAQVEKLGADSLLPPAKSKGKKTKAKQA